MAQSSGPDGDTGNRVVLDRAFEAATLAGLREAVLGCATTAGLSKGRAIDVMLAVHELAANVVRHGTGRGRARMQVTAGNLRCQVSDLPADGPASRPQGGTGVSVVESWPVRHGHGLWLVHQTADQIQVTTGPTGSVVSVSFALRNRLASGPGRA